jgi:ferredoxin
MKLQVDRERCEGYGFCAQAAPALLQLDDEGELEILQPQVPGTDVAAAESATRVCPVAALQVSPA